MNHEPLDRSLPTHEPIRPRYALYMEWMVVLYNVILIAALAYLVLLQWIRRIDVFSWLLQTGFAACLAVVPSLMVVFIYRWHQASTRYDHCNERFLLIELRESFLYKVVRYFANSIGIVCTILVLVGIADIRATGEVGYFLAGLGGLAQWLYVHYSFNSSLSISD